MPYGYNAQGQIVWTDDATPQGGTAVTGPPQGTFIPGQARDYMADTPVGAGVDELLGGAPSGKHFTQNGDLVNDSLWSRIDSKVMSPSGFAAGILGMSALGAATGGFGAGGTQVAPNFGAGLVSTTPHFSLENALVKAGLGALRGGLKGGWKGALEGAATGGMGSTPVTGGGGGMSWLDALKTGLGFGGGSGPLAGDYGTDTTDPGGETSGSGPSIWSRIWGGITGNGTPGKIIGTVGDVASGVEKGRSAERSSQNDFNVAQDRTRLSAMNDFETALENRAALDLKQKGFAQDYQGAAYKQALLGALGKNLQDVVANRPAGVPTIAFKGGLRPSAMGPEGRAAAALINAKAMKDLETGAQFAPLPAIERFTPSDFKSGNAIDTALGVAGTIGKVGDIWNQRTQDEKNQTWIDKIMADLKKQNSKGTEVPTGETPNYLMIDPKTGLPVVPESDGVA